MPKKSKVSQQDLDLFLNAIKGTKRLQKKDRAPLPKELINKPKKYGQNEEDDFVLSEKQVLSPVLSDETIEFKQPSISNKILRKLSKGQYNVEAVLDLHGMSVENAGKSVITFLQQCIRRQIRVALIIHGKGHHSQMPILKNKLNHWLREIDIVLAFCSATQAHGSRGAIYVLLKNTSDSGRRVD